jgi:ubiquitin-protein ligase
MISDKTKRQSLRLENELKKIAEYQAEKNNDTGFTVWSTNTLLTEWEGVILGPKDTPYSDGKFSIKILIPENYPCKPPYVFFTVPIYHPNISPLYSTSQGSRSDICIDILKNNWSPALTILSVLLSIRNLFSDPNFEDPLNPEAVAHYYRNKIDYEKKVRKITNSITN